MSEQYFTRPNIEKVIGKLGTTPEQRGLSTQEFKDKFDEMPEAIQQYIKETLLAELDAFKEEFMTHQAENVTEIITASIDVSTISDGSTMHVGPFTKKPKHISVVTRLNNQAAASWGEIDANNNQASMAINPNGVYSGNSNRVITIDMLGSSYAIGRGTIESDNRLKITWSKGSGSLTGELVICATAKFHGGE